MLSGPVIGAVLGSGALEFSHVVLQGAGDVSQQPQIDPVFRAIGGFLVTLIAGALLLAISPNYVQRRVRDIRDEPVACFAWGIAALIALFIVSFVLAITVVGVILLFPLLLVAIAVGIVGNVLAFVAVCDGFVDSRWVALLVASVVVALTNLLPVIGGIAGFVIGAIGIGAIVRRWMR